MPGYKLFFLTPEDQIFGRHELSCSDDLDALEKARELAKDHSIEIWQKTRCVGQVRPGNAAVNEDDLTSP